MAIKPRPKFTFPFADTPTPFDVTLAASDTAEDVVTVPSNKFGRIVSLVNEGPGSVALEFDGTAVVTDLLLEEGDAYDEQNLEISTNISFINVTPTETPRIRGILWSGD